MLLFAKKPGNFFLVGAGLVVRTGSPQIRAGSRAGLSLRLSFLLLLLPTILLLLLLLVFLWTRIASSSCIECWLFGFIFGFCKVRILYVGSAVEFQRPNSYSLHGFVFR